MRRRAGEFGKGTETTPSAPVRASVKPARPEGPACLFWGQEDPDLVCRWVLEEARERYRRDREELARKDVAGRRGTRAEANTRFAEATEAALQTRTNVDLLKSLPPEEATASRFVVQQISMDPNALIGPDRLLYGLPAVYVSKEKAPGGEEKDIVYDFRDLCAVVAAPGQGRPVSQRAIEGLTKYILSRYRSAGFAGVYVYVEADAVEGAARLADGILPIRVTTAKVANVTVKYFDAQDPNHAEKEKHWLKDEYLLKHSPVQEGQAIRRKPLDEYIRLLNAGSDRYVRTIVSPAQKPDAVNVQYDVFEWSPWHVYTQLDNSGTDTRQWNPRVGLLNTNLTGHDDLLSAMAQVDARSPEDNYAAFGRYEFPLFDPRLRVGFFGGISQFDITPESTGGFLSFLGDGEFGGANVRYNVVQIEDWMFDLTGSLSYEVSQIDRSVGVDSDVDMALAGVGFEIHRLHEELGQLQKGTSLSFERQENYTGNFADFQNARFGSDPDFIRYSLSAAHWQFIDPKNRFHQVSTRAKYIYPTARLVPAKMTTFGGLYTVRGYHEDEIVADGGLLASLEYRFYLSRYLSPSNGTGATGAEGKKGGAWWRPDVSLVAFTDYGRPEIKDPQAGEFDTQDMWGLGLGIILEVKKNKKDFAAAVYHSWALKETVRPSDRSALTEEGDSQWNFNFIFRF